MKNIHVIQTDKSKLIIYRKELYITNNEKPKDKDYVLSESSIGALYLDGIINTASMLAEGQWKKIILTTDLELQKDGVQAIGDEFLEWFCQNSSCEFVEIKEDKHLFCKHCDTLHSTFGDGINCDVCRKQSNPYLKVLGYKIIIPKEEIKEESKYTIGIDPYDKKETLEEAAEKFFNNTRFENYKTFFCEGAKWQQENSYSEEDLKYAFTAGFNARYKMQNGTESRERFIEQFKKK